MKYMGSKRAMLKNGLGELLKQESVGAWRFVDLFSGSGAVAIHVAQQFPIPVVAVDLQQYSSVITAAVVSRQKQLNCVRIWDDWLLRAAADINTMRVPAYASLSLQAVQKLRAWCARQEHFAITCAYGGHYFSPKQAVWIDALRANLPAKPSESVAALAALIHASSKCAAAPGHTAQPFQPTLTALPYLREAWSKDVLGYTREALLDLTAKFAICQGTTCVADANKYAQNLRPGDLVFIDPPYSGVHYSRFYHVLETIAQGNCGLVSGVGRYPDKSMRPRSRYSLKTESAAALSELLREVSRRGAKAILTFPDHDCSNGLSGESVRDIAQGHFSVTEQIVASRFSTLGGNNQETTSSNGRAARHDANELILVLNPS